MEPENQKTRRRERADSIRNREKLLEAATEVFSEQAGQATLEAVAKRAGVGIGTLYRHFPTREAVFEAVYRHEVELICSLADELVEKELEPFEALRRWLHALVRLTAAKKGMMEALQPSTHGSDLKAYTYGRMVSALENLLNRAIHSGSLRDDLTANDLLLTLFGIFYAQPSDDWQNRALKILEIFLQGLKRT